MYRIEPSCELRRPAMPGGAQHSGAQSRSRSIQNEGASQTLSSYTFYRYRRPLWNLLQSDRQSAAASSLAMSAITSLCSLA